MKKILLSLLSLMTLSLTAQIHFQEGFESGLPGTWASYIGTNGLGTVENWKVDNPGLLSDSAMVVEYENAGGVTEDWLVTPQITLGASNNRLRFYLGQALQIDYGSSFAVKVSTTSQTNHASFTNVASWTEADINYNTWSLQVLDLSAYNGQNIYIAFVMTQDDGDIWFMDSVVVETPTCLTPTNLNASSITSSSATLEWSGTGTSYQIAYYPNAVALNPTYVIATDSTHNLTGLSSNAYVTYFVREICAPGDTSLWSDGYSFTTLCTPNVTLPYSQNFDTDTLALLPCGWVHENNNSDNQRWVLATSSNAKSARRVLYITYNDSIDMDDWVFSPEFNLIGGATYDISFSYRTGTSFTFEDFLMTYGNGQNSGAQNDTIDEFYFINTFGSWIDTTLSITPNSTGNFAIGFHGISFSDQNFIMFDDFSIQLSPTTNVKENEVLSFNIYPNPNNGEFTISGLKANSSILITDVNGRIIENVSNINTLANINLSNVNKGVYFITVESNNIKTTKRVIVK